MNGLIQNYVIESPQIRPRFASVITTAFYFRHQKVAVADVEFQAGGESESTVGGPPSVNEGLDSKIGTET